MSVYSGFATRQQESKYNSCIQSLISALVLRLQKFYSRIQCHQAKFFENVTCIHDKLLQLQQNKYMPPHISQLIKPFALQLKNSLLFNNMQEPQIQTPVWEQNSEDSQIQRSNPYNYKSDSQQHNYKLFQTQGITYYRQQSHFNHKQTSSLNNQPSHPQNHYISNIDHQQSRLKHRLFQLQDRQTSNSPAGRAIKASPIDQINFHVRKRFSTLGPTIGSSKQSYSAPKHKIITQSEPIQIKKQETNQYSHQVQTNLLGNLLKTNKNPPKKMKKSNKQPKEALNVSKIQKTSPVSQQGRKSNIQMKQEGQKFIKGVNNCVKIDARIYQSDRITLSPRQFLRQTVMEFNQGSDSRINKQNVTQKDPSGNSLINIRKKQKHQRMVQ